jgi:hypothetical protein
LSVLKTLPNPPSSPFRKGGNTSPPFGLWPGGKREVGRDFKKLFQTAKLIQEMKAEFPGKRSQRLPKLIIQNLTSFIPPFSQRIGRMIASPSIWRAVKYILQYTYLNGLET